MENLNNKATSNTKKMIPSITTPSTSNSRSGTRAQETAKRIAAAQKRTLFILLGAALIINMGVGYFLYDLMVVETQAKNEQQLISQHIDSQTNFISNFVRTNQLRLDEAAKHPAVVQSVADKNKDTFAILANSFSDKFPDLIELKIFNAGEADVNPEGAVPIRFAELDLIRRAEKHDAALPEAALINDQWQIHFVSAVNTEDGKKSLGVVMLSLNINQLAKHISAIDPSTGETLLLQKFSGSPPQTITKKGINSRNKATEKDISGSHFLIKFIPSDNFLQQAEQKPTLWIITICGSTVLSLLLAFFISRLINKRQHGVEHQKTTSTTDTSHAATDTESNEVPSIPHYQHQNIFDIAVNDEDENILGLDNTSNRKTSAQTPIETVDESAVPLHIFRSYDIRGVVEQDLTVELAEKIGQAVGSEALDQGEPSLIVARDARTHSEELTNALIKGILRSGCNVVNIGVVPTPVMYFATYHFEDVRSGVMVTASHNPAEYNGFKVVINNNALADDAVLQLRTRILRDQLHVGAGEQSYREIIPHYIERIFSDVALAANISIVVDAGNAVTGIVAPQLFEELGCEVIPLFCDLDGSFPNHDPDPTQEKNLSALIKKVRETNADIGVAFDGDGDRLVVVTPKGDIIWPDRLLMLFAKDVLSRNPGADVLFDVKCSRLLNQLISSYGGRPIMWKTGHSPMKAKMVETGALIGGEYSGHIFIKDRWYGFDDGLYAMARLLEIITLRDQKIDDIFASFPQLVITPEIKIAVPDNVKFDFIKQLAAQADFQGGDIISIDGVRVDYSKGWGLVRASNTSPALTLRFEAESNEAMAIIQKIFKRELLKIDSKLTLNF